MIVKYCIKEHNCLKGSKLLVGNLEKYRTIENVALRDEGEGTFNFSIELLQGVKVSSEWANLIFGGFIGFGDDSKLTVPGRFEAHVENCDIEYVGNDIVSFRHAKANISYTALNSFIFCTSQVEDDPMKNCPFVEYDDYWQVGASKKDLDQFCVRVGNLLLRQLTEKNIVGGLKGISLSELKRVSINAKHGPVKYVDRSLAITQEMSGKFDEIMSSYFDSSFTKPGTPFSREREYRFLFTPFIDDLMLEAETEDVLLDINMLTSRL